MEQMGERGVSGVVTTVLLILVTIAAVSIIAGFVIPMIRENLDQGKMCFEARDHIKVDVNSGYTCYNDSATSITIERGFEDLSIGGIAVSILKEGERKRYNLDKGIQEEGVSMFDSSPVIEIPNPGESYTYVFSIGGGKRVDIALVLPDGKVCEALSYDLPAC